MDIPQDNFSCPPFPGLEFEFGMWVFAEGGKLENPEKNPRSKDENQQQTKPICHAGSGNQTQAPTSAHPHSPLVL